MHPGGPSRSAPKLLLHVKKTLLGMLVIFIDGYISFIAQVIPSAAQRSA